MGFLNRLFGDPQRDLERAESLLEKGEAGRALELARRAEARSQGADRARAARLAERAREGLVSAALERAEVAETSEYFEDAAEWLETALEHATGETERQELEARRAALLARAREGDGADADDDPWETPAPPDEGEPATELDPEIHYHALISMLDEEVERLYEGRPAPFRRAYVDWNEGRVEAALETLEMLVKAGGEDPVVRFERGRCRLMTGDAEGAVADLEGVWETFGDGQLDLAGEVSVPGLWAEAMLALGKPAPVLERLEPLADPGAGNPALTYRYGLALLAAERFDDARRFLARAASRYPSNPGFSHQLALVLERLGDRSAAIDCLETAIAPSCAGGSCGRPARHLPSIRALAGLYLDEGGNPERVRELMTLVARDLGGRLTSADHALLGRYHEQIGDSAAAARAAAESERLRAAEAAGESLERVKVPSLATGRRRAPI